MTISAHDVTTQRIRVAMDAAHVGFNGTDHFVGLLGPSPFTVTQEEWQRILASGDATWRWAETTNRLYHLALEGDARFDFVRALIEGESDPAIVAVQRRVALSSRFRPPCFVRLDQPIPGVSVEAQVPGTGWGYRQALMRAFGLAAEDTFAETFIAAVRKLTRNESPRVVYVLHRDDRFRKEVDAFALELRRRGLDYRVTVRELPKPGTADLIIRYYLSDFMTYDGASDAIDAFLAGDCEIDPTPNIVTDQKVGMILPFDPRTAAEYSDAVRALFPVTRLVRDGDIEALLARSQSNRIVALKYAGLKAEKRAFGAAVFNCTQCSRSQLTTLAKDIRTSGEPWILQDLLEQRFPIVGEQEPGGPVATRQLYTRFTPTFAMTEDGAHLMGCTVNARNEWKVASKADAVILPVIPRANGTGNTGGKHV